MTIDVLNLEWFGTPSRDRVMASLVCAYLRKTGLNVIEGSIFDGYHLLRKTKPKVLFMSNTVGADINFEIMRYAAKLGITGLSLTSEGNFRDDSPGIMDEFLWGWNKDQILYESSRMLWSNRAKNLALNHCPHLDSKLSVSGAVGFDIYKIGSSVNQKQFLARYGKQTYSKIIGVGCWDFGIFFSQDTRHKIISSFYSQKIATRLREDRARFQEILLQIIRDNPSVLFLIKEHPGVQLSHFASAIEGAESFPNTLILKLEEHVQTCLDVSDFWITFESTTALEAWLLNKQSCLLNPSGTDFPRDDLHKGSPAYSSSAELQNAIDHFYKHQSLPGFAAISNVRKLLIEDTIQWDDGLNHVRAGNKILDALDQSSHKNYSTPPLSRTEIRQHLIWKAMPILRRFKRFERHKKQYDSFIFSEFPSYQLKIAKDLQDFYDRQNLSLEDLRRISAL